MHKNLKLFIDTLYKDSDNIAVALCDDSGQKKKPALRNFNKKELFEKLSKENLERYEKERKYICIRPNLIAKGQRPIQENIKELNALFIDIDKGELPDKHLIEPHFVFERGGKFHIYWLIERVKADAESIEKYKSVTKTLIDYYGADTQVKDLLRLMRLPYTPHTKTGTVSKYELKAFSVFEKYKLSEINIDYRKEEKIDPQKKLPINENVFADILFDNYRNRIKKIFKGDGRSKELFHFGLNAFSWGLSPDKALSEAQKLNAEFFEPPETGIVVKHQIDSAYRYHKGEFGEYQKNYLTGSEEKQRKQVNQFRTEEILRDLLERWVYVTEAERLINLDTSLELGTQKQIENYLTNKTMGTVTFETILRKQIVTVADRINFKPQIPDRLYKDQGEIYLNRYRGHAAQFTDTPDKKAVSFFENHIKYLTTTDYEFKAVIDYFAYVIQNPGRKLPYALLIVSQFEGVGKSILENLFRCIYPHNVQAVENSDLDSGFNDYLVDSIFVFVHELAQGDKYNVMNKLKNKITENKLIINQKYAAKYTVDNAANFVFFSNRIDAIQASKHDRRLLVIYNDKEPQNPEYYNKLYEVLTEFYNDIFSYLMLRDLSKFNPNSRPEMTEGKKLLQQQSLSELAIFLNTAESDKAGPFANKLVTADSILRYAEMYAPDVTKHKIGTKAITNWLVDAGYKYKHVEKRINKIRVNKIFYMKKLEVITDSDILAVVDAGPEKSEHLEAF
jgi:hypothetical protein